MVAEARAEARSEINFEVYAKRQDRWIIEAVFADREQALKLGEDRAAVAIAAERLGREEAGRGQVAEGAARG